MSKSNGPPLSRKCVRLATRLALMLLLMPLAACATRLTATQSSTVCAPWSSIRYASKSKTNPRYAGPDLAPDLKVHNLTGSRLCGWK